MTPLYQKYADWMRELSRIARRPVERSCRTWAAYCAGMTPAMFAAEVLKL
jgi:hypothetical protein